MYRVGAVLFYTKIMRNSKLLYFIAFFVMITVISCSEDDKDFVEIQKQQLIGTWDAAPNEYGDIYEMVFMADGHFTDNVIINGRIDDIFEGTYIIEGNIINKSYTIHRERLDSYNWSKRECTDIIKFQFYVEGDKMTITSLSGDESAVYIRK